MTKRLTLSLLMLGSLVLFSGFAWGACASDEDCQFPGEIALECVEGECVNPNEPADDTTDVPISSLAASSYDVRCETGLDGECPTGYECDATGLCVRRSCSSDDDCASAVHYCDEGEGVCKPTTCEWDSDCPAYYFCLNQVCEFQPANFMEAGGANCRSIPQGQGEMSILLILGALWLAKRRRSMEG